MHIVTEEPQTPWWGHGMPVMEGNQSMKLNEGKIPDDALLRQQCAQARQLYEQEGIPHIVLPFSPALDAQYRHDFIFSTDGAITTVDKNGQPLGWISHFNWGARLRQPEAESMERFLSLQGMETIRLPDDAYLEGGEVHYTPYDHVYIGGLYRANELGHQAVVTRSHVKDVILLESEGFHLDTVLSPVLNEEGNLQAVLACLKVMKESSRDRLHKACTSLGVDLLEVDEKDSIGTKKNDFKDATCAVNCMPFPGMLFGNQAFQTPGIEEELKKRGIQHFSTPLTECGKSAGAYHCLTQRMHVDNPREVILWYMIGELAALHRLLCKPPAGMSQIDGKSEVDLMLSQLPLMDFDAYRKFGVSQTALDALKHDKDRFLSTYS
jgi:N-dimethylarginine dimethylaminohydrolase